MLSGGDIERISGLRLEAAFTQYFPSLLIGKNHLGILVKKCKFPGAIPDPLRQNLRSRGLGPASPDASYWEIWKTWAKWPSASF